MIGTKSDFSFLSILIRYEKLYALDPNQARATSKEYHDWIVEKLVDNQELEGDQLFDQIQNYQRYRTSIYDSETDDGFSTEVFQKWIYGEWTKIAKEMMKEGNE